MHNTGANWMSCVGCVGANYTVSTKPAAKNVVLRLVMSCCLYYNNLRLPSDPPTNVLQQVQLTMKQVTTAALHKKPYKCGLKPYDWYSAPNDNLPKLTFSVNWPIYFEPIIPKARQLHFLIQQTLLCKNLCC